MDDPRLAKQKWDGTTISQAPLQLPVDEHKGHKADAMAILRTSKPKLLRKFHLQQANSKRKG